MTQIRIKRGTRAELDAAASASGLVAGEPYLVTDEGRIAVGTAADAYADVTMDADIGDDPESLVLHSQLGSSAYADLGDYEPADATILKDADIGITVASESHTHGGVYAALGAENTFTAAQTITATSDAATLGDELAINGTFGGNADGWTLGTNWAYGANNVVLTLDGATEGTLSQNISVISGGLYLVEWSQTNSVANNGTIRPSIGAANGVYFCPTNTSAATMSQVITATATGTVALTFAATDDTSSGTITIDSVTVKQITPIDATLILKDTGNAAQLEVRVANSADDGNVALGNNALQSNTTGYQNSAQGAYALQSNTTGYQNSAHGASALQSNTAGFSNSAQGVYALQYNATGYQNSAQGTYALRYNTTGYQNSALGVSALQANTTGYQNSALGMSALQSNTTGARNCAQGAYALQSNTAGYNNSALGANALQSNTTGQRNSAQGTYALQRNTTGDQNSALGVSALQDNTTGYQNSAQGAYALQFNITGARNCAHGAYALQSNTTGYNNSAHGAYALQDNTTGYRNSAQGTYALQRNTTGYQNNAFGVSALQDNTTGRYNSALGFYALLGNITGSQNSALGVFALQDNTTGSNNTVVGYDTGRGITTGSYNTILGANVTGLSSSLTGNIILAANGIKAQFDGTNWNLQGSLAVGPSSPSAKIHAQATTEQLRIGYDATHYASATVDSAGNLAIISTNNSVKFAVGWKDLTSSMLGAGMPTQNAPTLTNFAPGGWTIRREYAFALNDYVYMQSFHVNHDIKPGGKAYIHMHWTTDGTSAAAVKWEFSYSRAKGHDQQAFSSPTTVSVTQAASGTAYQHMVAEIADIDALTLTEPDELIIITARRVTNGGTDNSDTVFGLMVDLHYEAEYYATKNKTPNFYS